MRLKNRAAVVTGAGGGIGRAIAHEFARETAKVIVVDIDCSAGEAVAQRIREEGGSATAVCTDVSSPKAVRSLVDETVRMLGAVHVLVNKAALQVNKTVEDTDVEEWNRQWAVNVGGVFLCSKYFLPHTQAARRHVSRPM